MLIAIHEEIGSLMRFQQLLEREKKNKKLNKNVSRNKQETTVIADLNIASVGVID